MKEIDFDRMSNPLDVLEGLDELPDFEPDADYLQLKQACARAYEAMCLQRIHRYSMEELKELIDVFADLATRADAVLHLYSANDAFVQQYMEVCERYEELKRYEVDIQGLMETCAQQDSITPTLFFGQWKEAYSALYDHTYFVTEFLRFRRTYENIRDISWFLEFDTQRALKALREYANYQMAGELLPSYWGYRYGELYDRIKENFELQYLQGNPVTEYLNLSGFKVAKSEVRVLLQFFNVMTDFEYQLLKSHIQLDR